MVLNYFLSKCISISIYIRVYIKTKFCKMEFSIEKVKKKIYKTNFGNESMFL